MMRGARNILWALPLCLLILWPLWGGPVTRFLTPKGKVDPSIKNPQSAAQGKTFTMDGVLFTQLKKGVKDWEIVAKRMFTGKDEDHLEMESVNAKVFEANKEKFHITSKTGQYNTKSKILTLRQQVKVDAEEGYVIRSPHLVYDDNRQKIRTQSKVHIIGEDMDVRGKGMIYNMKDGSYDIGGRVKVKSW